MLSLSLLPAEAVLCYICGGSHGLAHKSDLFLEVVTIILFMTPAGMPKKLAKGFYIKTYPLFSLIQQCHSIFNTDKTHCQKYREQNLIFKALQPQHLVKSGPWVCCSQ